MSLDNIVRINISSDNLSMQRSGFGVPLLLAEHDKDFIIKSYSSLEELKSAGFNPGDKIYEAAKTVFMQEPTVPLIKVGKLSETLDKIYAADSNFYGVVLLSEDPKIILNTAQWVEQRRLLLGVDISDPKLAAELKGKKLTRTYLAYQNLAAPLMAKMFAQKPGEASWAFQQLKNIESPQISTQLEKELETNNVNYFADIKGLGISLGGKMINGEYIDVIRGIDWLHARMQERIFGLMVKNKKIPFTDKGVDLIRSEIMAQMQEAIEVRILAEEPAPQVTAPPVAEISSLDKQKRLLPSVKFTGQLQGAIHQIQIEGSVNA